MDLDLSGCTRRVKRMEVLCESFNLKSATPLEKLLMKVKFSMVATLVILMQHSS